MAIDAPADSSTTAVDDSSSSSGFFNKQISVRLDDTNFLLWRQQVLLMIRGQGLEHYLDSDYTPPAKFLVAVDGTKSPNPAYQHFFKQDSSLASWLLSTVSTSILPHLVGSETTASIWNTLVLRYSKLSTTRVMHLHCRLRTLKKGSLSISEFSGQIKEICDLLAICGSPISEIEQVATILNGLPSDFESVIAVITASKEPYSFDGAVSLLTDAESRLVDPLRLPIGVHTTTCSSGSEFDTRSGYSPQSGSRGGRFSNTSFTGSRFKGRPRIQCQICGKLGHLVDLCWHRFNQDFKAQSSSSIEAHNCRCSHDSAEAGYTPFVSTEAPATSSSDSPQVNALVGNFSSWFLDSGATHHVTNDPSRFTKVQPYSSQGNVHIGDGSSLSISHAGQSILHTSTKPLIIDHLLHVPAITRNLLSVSKFATDNAVFFEFHPNYSVIKDELTGNVLLQGSRRNGLYEFTSSLPPPSPSVSLTTTSNDYWLWHNRMGHPTVDVINLALNKRLVVNKLDLCHACQLGKHHTLPYRDFTTVYSTPFQLVEIDLWGLAPIQSDGFSYYMACVDMHSRVTWVYLLRKKSDACTAFEMFYKFIETQFSTKLLAVQVDGGGEFKFLEHLLVQLGV
ncbi:hypothetical protein HRI_000799100 [Hibiscus trionum]|uniref:Integrase catalytic domain-containing protein n=1 Tax=Hibiscus trionum TaxID=183268 RepID=A0A9W7LNQ2_HIBTR|nr:hypothetical protein HRI_000799100 [Hibiscus trionum]